MFKVEGKKLFWKERPALARDFIIPEDVLRSIPFEEDDQKFSQMVVIDNMLVYVMKYKENGCLTDLWHFAFQTIEKNIMYESYPLYLGV